MLSINEQKMVCMICVECWRLISIDKMLRVQRDKRMDDAAVMEVFKRENALIARTYPLVV